ncbi:unnamed protein product, partial [marine sediment metagenome]
VPDEDLGELKNLGEFVKYIETRLAEKGTAKGTA